MILIFIIALILVRVQSHAIGDKDLSDEQGLYNASDHVVILNFENFNSTVHNSDRAWFVEFYNTWCGHCRRFAPTWKNFSKEVYNWRDIVAIGVIDCSTDDNGPLCREYEIMRYPTLRFFHVNSAYGYIGLDFHKNEQDTMHIKQELIDQLLKEQEEQRGTLSWPNIAPYRGSSKEEVKTLFKGPPNDIKCLILIIEETGSYMGAEVILDLHKLSNVHIRRMSKEQALLSGYEVKLPSILIYTINNPNEELMLPLSTISRESAELSILKYLNDSKYNIEMKYDDEKYFSDKNILSYDSKMKSTNTIEEDDELYQLDLDSALKLSLNHEIPMKKVIDQEKLKALRLYLTVLAEYYPGFYPKTAIYLQDLKKAVEIGNNITGPYFEKLANVTGVYLADEKSNGSKWKSCQGSKPGFRGYSCGLWNLFHALTVRQTIYNNSINPQLVLNAMHGYIKHFFGCTECSKHFQSMAERRDISKVQNSDQSVLWLWEAHNEVNERLAGDYSTEDPQYPKIQYPSEKHCKDCRNSDGSWNEIGVLNYLKNKYKTSKEFRELQTSVSSSGVSHRRFVNWDINWRITKFDISICVVLYVLSTLIIVTVFIKFAVKRTNRKRISLHNLLGL